MHRAAAGQLDRRLVRIVGRVEQDDFVAGTDDGLDGTEERLGATRGHRDLVLGVNRATVVLGDLGGNRVPQTGQAGHWCVLVAGTALAHVLAGEIEQALGRIEVGEPLGKIDGTVFRGKTRHDREDRGADSRQLAVDRRGHEPHCSSGSALPSSFTNQDGRSMRAIVPGLVRASGKAATLARKRPGTIA